MKLSIISFCVFAALAMSSCAKHKSTTAPSNETAPASFKVDFDTTKGPVIVEITRVSAPHGVDRFYNLVKAKYFDGARFFRVVPGFVVQFGIAADPDQTSAWDVSIPDDPVLVSNKRGTMTFASTSEPDSRSTQLFFNVGNNSNKLDPQHFSAFGQIVSGMDSVDQIYAGDGEKPQQDRIEKEGNAYLVKEFPRLDYIKTARIVQ